MDIYVTGHSSFHKNGVTHKLLINDQYYRATPAELLKLQAGRTPDDLDLEAMGDDESVSGF